MNIYPPIEQRFSPFEFYSLMRKNNPVAFDEGNGQWGLYRYNDIEKILKDPIGSTIRRSGYFSSMGR